MAKLLPTRVPMRWVLIVNLSRSVLEDLLAYSRSCGAALFSRKSSWAWTRLGINGHVVINSNYSTIGSKLEFSLCASARDCSYVSSTEGTMSVTSGEHQAWQESHQSTSHLRHRSVSVILVLYPRHVLDSWGSEQQFQISHMVMC